MTRILKTLGLAMAAMAALVAMIAPAAQAETGALTTVGFPSIITGQKQGVNPAFDIGNGPIRTVSCGTADLEATLENFAVDPVTFKPLYENCTSEPGGATPVTVTMNGCHYTIGFGKPNTTQQPETTGTMRAAINCPAGQKIQIHVYENVFAHAMNVSTCTYDIGPQASVPAGIYHNTAGGGIPDVTATLSATFTATSTIGFGGAICGGNPETEHLPITITGDYTMKAFVDAGGFEGGQWPLDVG